MIIVCDKCERRLEVDDELIGRKITCPNCGDVNTVRAPGAGVHEAPPVAIDTKRVDRAAAAGLPPDFGPEQRVMLVRPAVYRSRPLLALLLALLVVGGIAVGSLAFGGVVTAPAGIPAFIGAGICLLILLGWKASRLDAALEVTTKRTVERIGFFSKRTTEVMHDDIRNVQINQSFFDRLLGIGELGISSSAQDGIEIVMRHVPDPEKIRKTIDLYRPI